MQFILSMCYKGVGHLAKAQIKLGTDVVYEEKGWRNVNTDSVRFKHKQELQSQ